jgi:S1-C subfamily serine protease
MFRYASANIRETLYGIIGRTNLGATTNNCMGSGIMVAPNFIVTNSHILHLDGNTVNKNHTELMVIRSPDIGQDALAAQLIKEDTFRDIALLKINSSTSRPCAILETDRVPSGTSCGSLGFPLSSVASNNGGLRYTFIERFQGAFISAYITEDVSGKPQSWYEVDRVMYGGSSGCPFFMENGKVIGLQTRVRNSDGNPHGNNYLAISLLIPSPEVAAFLRSCGVT